ncbi:MAG TPA: DUF5658 family protein [Candidatus Eisenbacteria bacterium]|nr:DUF5658 family protein [Candidatus Eisenbacteria bacterium]
MAASSSPAIEFYFVCNLLLQLCDAMLTYHALAIGIPEANPLVAGAIALWGELWGLLFWKSIACMLLLLIFFLRHLRRDLAAGAFKLTATVYGCAFVVALYQLLFHLRL